MAHGHRGSGCAIGRAQPGRRLAAYPWPAKATFPPRNLASSCDRNRACAGIVSMIAFAANDTSTEGLRTGNDVGANAGSASSEMQETTGEGRRALFRLGV